MTSGLSPRHGRARTAAGCATICTLLLPALPAGAMAQSSSRFRSPQGWTLLVRHTQLPVQPGGVYRLRATVLNATDQAISADSSDLCTWTVRADVSVEEVSRGCDPPDGAFLAPADSTTLEVALRVRGPSPLDAVRLEDSDGKAMLADGASPDARTIEQPMESAAVRVPYVLELSADEGVSVRSHELNWVVERGISTATGGSFTPVSVEVEAAGKMARSWPVLRLKVSISASGSYSIAACWWTGDRQCAYATSHGEGGLLLTGVEVLDAVRHLMALRRQAR